MDRFEILTAAAEFVGNAGRYYDKEGLPITVGEWARRMEDDEYKRVAATYFAGGWVSTCWLGLDHQFFDEQEPLIFESMIFTADTGHKLNRAFRRYPSLEVALEGHRQMVELMRADFGEPVEKESRAPVLPVVPSP